MTHDKIWYVFRVHPHTAGPQRQLLGKFYLGSQGLSVLEDHGMAPGEDIGKTTPARARALIERMARSQRREVVNGEDLRTGRHPHLLPSTDRARGGLPSDLKEAIGAQLRDRESGPRRSSFQYHRQGMPAPQLLELHGDRAFLDGHPLEPAELQHIQTQVKSGGATLRHHLEKAELRKALDPQLTAALAQIRAAVEAGHVHPDAMRTVNRTLFSDTMVPNVGNKMAYQDFLSRPRQGVYVHIDGNDFGSVNKIHDFETGNQGIIGMGGGLRQAMDESVGRKHGKLFRVGGDEFVAFVPTHEHAALFARSTRSKLEAIPALRGTHRLSVSMGWGPTPQHAEQALHAAKAAKKAAGAPLGQAKTHAASAMPGREGVIPVE